MITYTLLLNYNHPGPIICFLSAQNKTGQRVLRFGLLIHSWPLGLLQKKVYLHMKRCCRPSLHVPALRISLHPHKSLFSPGYPHCKTCCSYPSYSTPASPVIYKSSVPRSQSAGWCCQIFLRAWASACERQVAESGTGHERVQHRWRSSSLYSHA